MNQKDKIVIGLLGPTLDEGRGAKRWEKWRPTVALCQHEDLLIKRLELLHQRKFADLARRIVADIETISPETEVRTHEIEFADAWNLEQVYSALRDFSHSYRFDTAREDYLIHITTGTHIAQICMFLLTESRYFPATLIQTSPPQNWGRDKPGKFEIIDLDLSKYDRIASRFQEEQREAVSFLKAGIATRNKNFNRLIERIEQVAIHSRHPMLLMGATGAGKSSLAKRLYELKYTRHQLTGAFVEVNCATLRGDSAMSALFGHTKGAFTGAVNERKGHLRSADDGLLFLDEIGSLGSDEQAMLLRALEEKSFFPLGADREVRSDFQLVAGTNSDLATAVREGKFREDLLARINLWTFKLPSLKERIEDIEPNLEYELEKYASRMGKRVTFSKEALSRFLKFATSAEAQWTGNFRDLNGAVVRMATLASGGRISVAEAAEEIERLRESWRSMKGEKNAENTDELERFLSKDELEKLDLFDRMQLAKVIKICAASNTLSEAGRTLFSTSRNRKTTTNDADRLRKYLARFGLDWRQLQKSA
jgi:transcriptional regulatory protein RtcR